MKRLLILVLLIVTHLAFYMRHSVHMHADAALDNFGKVPYNNITEAGNSNAGTVPASFTGSDHIIAYPALSY